MSLYCERRKCVERILHVPLPHCLQTIELFFSHFVYLLLNHMVQTTSAIEMSFGFLWDFLVGQKRASIWKHIAATDTAVRGYVKSAV